MRRISTAVAATVVSLFAAQLAFAATTSFSGSFAGKGSISFKLSTKHAQWQLFSLAFRKFPLECAGGRNTETAALKPSYRPVQPDYPNLRVDAVFTHPHHQKPLSTLLLTGTVTGAGASGNLRIHGRKVPVDRPSGSSDRCDSGKVHWSASSG